VEDIFETLRQVNLSKKQKKEGCLKGYRAVDPKEGRGAADFRGRYSAKGKLACISNTACARTWTQENGRKKKYTQQILKREVRGVH